LIFEVEDPDALYAEFQAGPLILTAICDEDGSERVLIDVIKPIPPSAEFAAQ
jgi:hypothetical protein